MGICFLCNNIDRLKALIFISLLLIIIVLSSGCLNVVQNRNFINDGSSTKYELSSYRLLDSVVNSLNCDTVITLERSGCLGKCPVFKLALLSNGSAYFYGRHNVNKSGLDDTTLSKNELSMLLAEFYQSGFFKLQEKYDLSNCAGYSDLSSLVLFIKTNNASKQVSFYKGCIDYKTEGRLVSDLAAKIEKISNMKEWIH